MSKNLQDLSNEELLTQAKNAKLAFGMFIGVIIGMTVTSVITTVKQGVNAFTFLPVAFLGVAMVFRINYDKLRKELKSRNIK
jgi:hypothetical protein